MPFNLIALLIILISGGVLLFLIIRKFPHLANLDSAQIPETVAKKKQRLIEERFVRALHGLGGRMGKVWAPLLGLVLEAQRAFRRHVAKSKNFLLKTERLTRKPGRGRQEEPAPAERVDRIERILGEADHYFETGKYTDAEKRYLEAIKLDSRNANAYRGLGKVYMKSGAYDDAVKTFEFLLQMTPDDDTLYVKLGKTAILAGNYQKAADYYTQALAMKEEVPVRHFEMAEIYKHLGDVERACQHAERALQLEPDNPRYLDGALEISIMAKRKKESEELFKRLRIANPENKKLQEFRQRIDEL